MKKILFFICFLLSSLIILNFAFAVDQACLRQCAGIHTSCVAKCLSPHPTYQSCKAVCDSNRDLCVKQCGSYDETQKKLQDMESPK